MLTINHLTIQNNQDLSILIDDLSLVIHPGEKWAIIGEEGSGKSTLIKWITEEKLTDHFHIEGHKINSFLSWAYLPQFMPSHQAKQSIELFLFENIDFDEIDYSLLAKEADKMGFSYDRLFSDQIVDSLSGGEWVKLNLLKMLIQEVELFILDEPSNDLDIKTLSWLINFIKTSQKTFLFVSHDEKFLNETAQGVIHLEKVYHRQQARHQVISLDYSSYVNQRLKKIEKNHQVTQSYQREYNKKIRRQQELESKLHHALNRTKNSSDGRLLAKK